MQPEQQLWEKTMWPKASVFFLTALIALIKDIIISPQTFLSKLHVCTYVLNYLSCLAGAVYLPYKRSLQRSSAMDMKEEGGMNGEWKKRDGDSVDAFLILLAKI